MTGQTLPRGDLAAILRLVEERAGLVLRATRWAEFEAVVSGAVAAAGAAGVWDYLERTRTDPGLFEQLVTKLVIGETYFFREANQIRELRERIIPALATGVQGTIRVWSAGCSSGEEAYSLAILFIEAGLSGRAEIVGTDLSPGALEKAQGGLYRPWSFRGVDDARMSRYFEPLGDCFRVNEDVRRNVRFMRHNLAADAFPPEAFGGASLNLVLCRNVLFYFNRERARDIGERLMSCLGKGGVLVAGPSDPILRCDPPMEALVTPGGLFYRRGAPGAFPVQRSFSLPIPLAETPASFVGVPALALPDAARDQAPVHVASESCGPPAIPPVAPEGAVSKAAEAFSAGDYERAVELTEKSTSPVDAVLRVRALANARGTGAAVEECEKLLQSHRFDVELTYLLATLLLDTGRTDDAYRSARQVVYLDRSLEVGHFLMATIAMRRGDVAAATRALRHAHRIAIARLPDDVVPLGDGQRAAALATAARDWLERCERSA